MYSRAQGQATGCCDALFTVDLSSSVEAVSQDVTLFRLTRARPPGGFISTGRCSEQKRTCRNPRMKTADRLNPVGRLCVIIAHS